MPLLYIPPRLMAALDDLAPSVRGLGSIIDTNGEAMVGATLLHKKSVERLEKAIYALVKAISPKKATRVTVSTRREPPSSPQGETEMDQYHVSIDGFAADLLFNGPIDGEPTISNIGVGTVTQDFKVERPVLDENGNPVADKIETVVTCHFRSDSPGMAGISGSAVVDKPETENETETLSFTFAEVAQWIPQAQAKATTVTISTRPEVV